MALMANSNCTTNNCKQDFCELNVPHIWMELRVIVGDDDRVMN